MKISRNPSRQGIGWRWRFMLLVAFLTVPAAILFPSRTGEMVGAGVLLVAISYASKMFEEDLLVAVFDDGDCLRLLRGNIHVSVELTEIEKITFQDGGDGSDIVTLSLVNATPWGQHVDFLPEPHYKFGGDVKHWFADLETRIRHAKANESAGGTENSTGNSPTGRVWDAADGTGQASDSAATRTAAGP